MGAIQTYSRRDFMRLVGGASAALAFAACGGDEQTAGGQELTEWVVGAAEDPTIQSNPIMVPGSVGSGRAFIHAFDGLLMADGPELEIRGVLAERWELVNPTLIRFHLRDGVTFHDGSPLTAEDVKYTYEEGLKKPELFFNFYFGPLKGITAVDPLTLEIELKEPHSPLIYNLALFGGVVSKKVRESMGVDAFNRRPVGAGPYKVAADWQPGQPVQLERYDDYWGGQARPQKLTVKLIQEASTRTAELISGRAHIVENITIADIPFIERSGKAEVRELKASDGLGRIIEYCMNPGKPYFADLRVRQALNYAVDRESIVNDVMEGHADILTGIMPKGWLGYLPDLEPWPYDPDKARTLLREAGWEDLEFTWEITDGVFLRDREVAEAIAAQLAEVGIRANLRITERAVQFEHYYAGTWDVNTLQWPTEKDPDSNMLWIWVQPGGNNTYQPYDICRELTAKAASTYDLEERRKVYEELNRVAWELCPWIYCQVQNEIWAKDKRISWEPYASWGQATETWYYDRAALDLS